MKNENERISGYGKRLRVILVCCLVFGGLLVGALLTSILKEGGLSNYEIFTRAETVYVILIFAVALPILLLCMIGSVIKRKRGSEFLPEYVGTDHGLTYFSIAQGRLWFTMLDTGEDNSNGSYGDIADYEGMWEDQIRMLEEQIQNADKEYLAEGVQVRIALCHVPFTRYTKPCGDIFLKWTELLNQMNIHLMISGHTHSARFTLPENSPPKELLPNFPCVECTAINRSDLSTFKGTALIIGTDRITVRFTDAEHQVVKEYTVDINNVILGA